MVLARRNVTRDRTRLVLSILGVGLATMLVLLMAGFESGLYRQLAAHLERTPGSLVVAQEGVAESLGVTSLLPREALARVEATDGVGHAIPVTAQFVILDLHDRKQPAYLVGYQPRRGGGPWELAQGREPAADDEAVLDRILADRHGVAVGDTFDLMGTRFEVVGLSTGTSSWMTSYVFVRASAASVLLRAPDAVSYVFVTPAPHADAQTVAARLRSIPGVEVTPKGDVIEHDRALMARIFAAPVRLMTGIAFVVGSLVVGLVLYTATVERRREYGVLKAVGARNRTLYRVTTTQAVVVGLAGALAGIGLTGVAGQLVMAARPEFLVTVEPAAIVAALAASLAMSLLGALVPARLVAQLAPADVFRR